MVEGPRGLVGDGKTEDAKAREEAVAKLLRCGRGLEVEVGQRGVEPPVVVEKRRRGDPAREDGASLLGGMRLDHDHGLVASEIHSSEQRSPARRRLPARKGEIGCAVSQMEHRAVAVMRGDFNVIHHNYYTS